MTRPASRLTSSRFSFRALDPHSANDQRPGTSANSACTSFSSAGTRWTSSTTTHEPAGSASTSRLSPDAVREQPDEYLGVKGSYQRASERTPLSQVDFPVPRGPNRKKERSGLGRCLGNIVVIIRRKMTTGRRDVRLGVCGSRCRFHLSSPGPHRPIHPVAMKNPVNVLCIGAGYVGGPTMAVIADKCPHAKVTVVDINEARIDAWKSDSLPIFEPGLLEVVKRARGRNLFFSTDIASGHPRGRHHLRLGEHAHQDVRRGRGAGREPPVLGADGRQILAESDSDKIVVEKSTLPVRTAEAMETHPQQQRPRPALRGAVESRVPRGGHRRQGPRRTRTACWSARTTRRRDQGAQGGGGPLRHLGARASA